jgi:phasin family protein
MAKKTETDSIIDMFAQFGRRLNVSDADIDRVIEHHRRNLEAFEESARSVSSGTASLMARQREILEEMAADIREMSETYRTPSNPAELMAKQAEFTRKGFEAAVRNTGEVAGMVARSSSEALDILRKRMQEGMTEIREGMDKRK